MTTANKLAVKRTTLTTLSWDDDQELKEAVCDAVLERARRAVSGTGDFGAVIFGQLPSRALTSGFLLPRLNEDDDDISTDIAISLHGLDCRMNAAAPGTIHFIPRFDIYVRVLPTAEEVFNVRLRLKPKAELNAAANGRKAAFIKGLREDDGFKNMDPASKRQARKERLARFLADLGVMVKAEDVREGEVEGQPQEDGEPNTLEILDGNARIPDEHAVTHEVPEKFLRLTPELPTMELSLPWTATNWAKTVEDYQSKLNAAVQKAYADWLASDQGATWAWRSGRLPGSSFWSPTHWETRLSELRKAPAELARLIPGMEMKAVIDVRPDPLDPEVLTARFALENYKEGKAEAEQGIFGVALQLLLPDGALRRMPMERVRRSYHFAGFLLVPAIGVNGGVEHREEGGQDVLSTTWCPRFVLPRMRPTSHARIPVTFNVLADASLDVSILDGLPSAMEEWVAKVEVAPVLCEPGEEGTKADEDRQKVRFEEDLKAWRREAARIRLGVQVLVRSQAAHRTNPTCPEAIPYRAWLMANQTFAKATDNPGWRLFQLGFILTHVPTLASRIPQFEDVFDHDFDEGSASLLYMSTGGGKSEAFFGTLMLALFMDRLRGKHRGVTAMLHYPLRLLTLQQARRLMKLLAAAETLRFRSGLGGASFELGFWVGSGNTPNSITNGTSLTPEARDIPLASEDTFLRREDALLSARRGYQARNDAWNKLPECPFCQARTGLRIFPEEENRLGIVCSGTACDWNADHDTETSRRPLPFLLVDADIYRRAPSVLLGTVDKLALIGNHPSTINRIAGMFGLARFVAGGDDGLLLTPLKADALKKAAVIGHRVAPAYSNGKELFHDPIPSLVVQDEMHLLEESLGTFGGLFETTLFAMFSEFAQIMGHRAAKVPGSPGTYRMPHIIGATATAADADRQMQNLYQRKSVQFPHPGPRLYASFYTELETFGAGSPAAAARGGRIQAREQESLSPWGRVYASLLTNGKTHTTATIEVLATYAVGITRWSRDLCSADGARRARACDEMVESLSGGELSARHAAALRKAGEAGLHEALARLVDLHRIMLTYVTNKKGGDQLMSALDRQVARQHELAGPEYEISFFDIELISGGVDIKSIQAVIAKAEKQRNPATEDVSASLRAIVATSAISHGVDVSAFNAMTFAGVPSDVAEYIQASSRVGRTHVGFSLLLPTPQNRRDRFVIDNHETFHRFLERMIAPPAIVRWADKAIRRTLPSLVQAYLIGVLYQREFVEAADEAKDRVIPADGAIALRDRLVGTPAAATKAAMRAFLERAVGMTAAYEAAPTPDHYNYLLRQVIEDIATELQTGKHGGDLAAFWGSPDGSVRLGKPMTSLRDVDEAGMLHGSATRRTVTGAAIKASDTRAAMDFVTKRMVAGRRTASEASELSAEGG